MRLQYPFARYTTALVLTVIAGLMPFSASAQSKTDVPEGQVWYNGDRAVPIWFAEDAIAILNSDSGIRSTAELSQFSAQMIPGSEVTQTSDFGGIVQLPPSQNATELLASADTVTRVPNRYAAVYRTDPINGGDLMIQNGELVVFANSGVSQEQIDSIVVKPYGANFLRTLIEGQAYLYSCASDQSCLQAANEPAGFHGQTGSAGAQTPNEPNTISWSIGTEQSLPRKRDAAKCSPGKTCHR